MPILNIDEKATSFFEPIEFVLGGKVYRVQKLTEELAHGAVPAALGALSRPEPGADAPEFVDAWPMARALSVFTGAPAEEFAGCDVRALRLTINYINETVAEQIRAAGNPSAGKRKSSR